MDDFRPILNSRAQIRLETPLEPRADHVVQATLGSENLQIADYNINEHGLNDIVFNVDRITVAELNTYISRLEQLGTDLVSSDLYLWSTISEEGKLMNIRVRLEDMLLEAGIALEIPVNLATKQEILSAFKIESGYYKGESRVEVDVTEDKYVLTPALDEKFILAYGPPRFDLKALSSMLIEPEDCVYAGTVRGREATGFF